MTCRPLCTNVHALPPCRTPGLDPHDVLLSLSLHGGVGLALALDPAGRIRFCSLPVQVSPDQ